MTRFSVRYSPLDRSERRASAVPPAMANATTSEAVSPTAIRLANVQGRRITSPPPPRDSQPHSHKVTT
ncbi:hypothetical protein [Archangium violaceum]|uniref:hypothetical protein n=1 Tax=Archangium violaceum TaxID=83451 RepID=UPI001EEF9C9C|nr:hypothetical protein [Archangium violaceum]